jgi:hypothetical protein
MALIIFDEASMIDPRLYDKQAMKRLQQAREPRTAVVGIRGQAAGSNVGPQRPPDPMVGKPQSAA